MNNYKSEILSENEIDDLLYKIDSTPKFSNVETSKINNNKNPILTTESDCIYDRYDIDFDLQYQCKLSQLDIFNLKKLIIKVLNNYVLKLRNIKETNQILLDTIKAELIKSDDIKNYIDFKKSNNNTVTKKYYIDEAPIYISISKNLINNILDRDVNHNIDTVTSYASKIYFFDVITNYIEQLCKKNEVKFQEKPNIINKNNTIKELCLLNKGNIIYNDNKIDFVIVIPTSTCMKIAGIIKKEIRICSSDYYKKRNCYAVISETHLNQDQIENLSLGQEIEFPVMWKNRINLVMNNKLIARGICKSEKTYYDTPTSFVIKEKLISPKPEYFTSKNNGFIIFGTIDKSLTKQCLDEWKDVQPFGLRVDTEIHTSTFLLVVNCKIIGTVEIESSGTNIKAKIKRLLNNPISIIK